MTSDFLLVRHEKDVDRQFAMTVLLNDHVFIVLDSAGG